MKEYETYVFAIALLVIVCFLLLGIIIRYFFVPKISKRRELIKNIHNRALRKAAKTAKVEHWVDVTNNTHRYCVNKHSILKNLIR